MEMMKITNGKKTLEVSEKAYRVVFAEKGFKPVEEAEEAQQEDEGKKAKRGK
jgi:hypothetical protein